MGIGLLGRKVGMTQVFDGEGRVIPVTVVEAGPCIIVQKKTVATDGYEAIQVAYLSEKPKHVSKPLAGHFAKAKVPPMRHLEEMRLHSAAEYGVGQTLTVSLFADGEEVVVTGTSKGRGFQGGVKRWGYRGGAKTHGSMFYRAPGSIGASSFPSRVFKGHHMPGRMGGAQVTIRGLRVVRSDPGRNLLLIRGAVPGPQGGLVAVRKTGKGTGVESQGKVSDAKKAKQE
ncbi:MAG: 50S ribosomal protein L3 [candidate division NC10 bacterium]|nr:50S ribosomal protein L3 [candidate division NC10 bacterium]